jgi:hypothetical protein
MTRQGRFEKCFKPDILIGAGRGVLAHPREERHRGRRPVSGDHRPEGVIVAAWPKVTAFEQQPLLIDLGADHPGRARRAGLDPAPGRVLHEVVGAEASVRGGEAPPTTGGREDEPSVIDTEADEMEEHLRGLGYLE